LFLFIVDILIFGHHIKNILVINCHLRHFFLLNLLETCHLAYQVLYFKKLLRDKATTEYTEQIVKLFSYHFSFWFLGILKGESLICGAT
jgi:hypothetical protein